MQTDAERKELLLWLSDILDQTGLIYLMLTYSLQEERERCSMITDELSKMEVKLKEQIKANESLRMQLAAEEDRYKVSAT